MGTPSETSTRRLSAPRLSRIEIAVLISGTTSMGLEILAGRIIAPTFGSSIFTWGAIIGVFLTALSAGYWNGGKQARDQASPTRLAVLLALATVFVAFVIFAGDPVIELTRALNLPSQYEPLIPITILFGPPTYLLGFVSPYAAELSEKEGTGEASGHVYALGTIGSIVGAFATTFVLVPTLSIELIGLLFGGLLLTGALVVSSRTPAQVAGVVIVAAMLVSAATVSVFGVPGSDTIYRTETAYQQLEVVDDDGTRILYLDGQRHSAMDVDQPNRHVFTYTRYFHLPLLYEKDVDDVLFIGGGGFTGPKIFADMYDVNVDVVEIDPEVIRVAKEYFNVTESDELDIHQGDGRRFLEQTDETYDLIVLDAYRKDRVPFQLTTVEFMQLAKSKLSDDGVLLANIISAPSGSGSKFFRAEIKTMRQVFPRVYAFPTVRARGVQNIEVIATKNSTLVTQTQLEARNDNWDVGLDLSREISFYRTEVDTADVPILRDDHAPVDRLIRANVDQQYVLERTNQTATPTGEPALRAISG